MESLLCLGRLINGHKEVAELLIAEGADVNTKNDFLRDSFVFCG